MFTHLKLCFASTTLNFKCVITNIIFIYFGTEHLNFLLINPLTAKLFNLNFHPLEVVSRWGDPQLQVSENYSDLKKMEVHCFQFLLIDVTFYL